MAWWLDPARQSEPIQLQSSRTSRENNPLLAKKTLPTPEIPALPAGIERIVAIDPQNALIVSGTDAAFAALEKIVALLDQPLRQVEIEGQFVQISAEDARQLGVSLSLDPKNRYATVPLDAQALARLSELKAANKARVITAPRVLAINHLTAELASYHGDDVVVDISTRATESAKSVVLSGADGQMMTVSTGIAFNVTPTINADDSIALQLAPARLLKLSLPRIVPPELEGKSLDEIAKDPKLLELSRAPQQETVLSRRALEGALIETTVQDGQTIALTGFTSRLFANFLEDAKKPASNVLLLVTTRLIRRADDGKTQTISLPR